mmetsp:Transcript_21462/g.34933  ORF Transcript_21462/g.34933 Transcript_21462/m.34933 type:complete len:146 (-) Transcript_21462:1261-1698(-)
MRERAVDRLFVKRVYRQLQWLVLVGAPLGPLQALQTSCCGATSPKAREGIRKSTQTVVNLAVLVVAPTAKHEVYGLCVKNAATSGIPRFWVCLFHCFLVSFKQSRNNLSNQNDVLHYCCRTSLPCNSRGETQKVQQLPGHWGFDG